MGEWDYLWDENIPLWRYDGLRMSSKQIARTHVVLPADLLKAIDSLVG
jgi:hypothetical protein